MQIRRVRSALHAVVHHLHLVHHHGPLLHERCQQPRHRVDLRLAGCLVHFVGQRGELRIERRSAGHHVHV